MELALLSDVGGREGGAEPAAGPGGVPPAAVVEAGRGMPGPPTGGGAETEGLPVLGGGGALPAVDGRLPGEEVGGAELWLRDLGAGPFGGGGVARAEAVALLGSFLFTHFFSSGS